MSKRESIARVCAATGITRILEGLPKQRCLLVLNYHRVGRRLETPYDPGTFSATAEEFDDQISLVKRRFAIVSMAEALERLQSRTSSPAAAVLVTFDDGYLDNYAVAYPILRSHGAPAAFFLPTAFVGSGKLPWWDIVAYQVRRSRKTQLDLRRYGASFDLAEPRLDALIQVLRIAKRVDVPLEEFLEEITRATEVDPPGVSAERCFLSWDEALEMQKGGMYFGSHTHRHDILSKIPEDRQVEELRTSRALIEQHLGGICDVLAYPVGGRDTFSEATYRALRATGYRAAFSYYGGLNRPGQADPFNILRHTVDSQSLDRLRLQTAAVSVFGAGWI